MQENFQKALARSRSLNPKPYKVVREEILDPHWLHLFLQENFLKRHLEDREEVLDLQSELSRSRDSHRADQVENLQKATG